MAYVAQLQVPQITPIIFTCVQSDRGYPVAMPEAVLEEINTPGVDGRRWRLTRTSFPDFQLTTYCDFPSYAYAVQAAKVYQAAVGQPSTLIWSASDLVNQSYPIIMPLAVQTKVFPAVCGGITNSGNNRSVAMLRAVWRFACTQVG